LQEKCRHRRRRRNRRRHRHRHRHRHRCRRPYAYTHVCTHTPSLSLSFCLALSSTPSLTNTRTRTHTHTHAKAYAPQNTRKLFKRSVCVTARARTLRFRCDFGSGPAFKTCVSSVFLCVSDVFFGVHNNLISGIRLAILGRERVHRAGREERHEQRCSVTRCYLRYHLLQQCVVVCCSVSQCVAVRCSVLQCVAVCCSVLQCVAVCCRGGEGERATQRQKERVTERVSSREEECVSTHTNTVWYSCVLAEDCAKRTTHIRTQKTRTQTLLHFLTHMTHVQT